MQIYSITLKNSKHYIIDNYYRRPINIALEFKSVKNNSSLKLYLKIRLLTNILKSIILGIGGTMVVDSAIPFHPNCPSSVSTQINFHHPELLP